MISFCIEFRRVDQHIVFDKTGSVAEFMGEMALDGGAWGAASPS
jgi:hypothetical protein